MSRTATSPVTDHKGMSVLPLPVSPPRPGVAPTTVRTLGHSAPSLRLRLLITAWLPFLELSWGRFSTCHAVAMHLPTGRSGESSLRILWHWAVSEVLKSHSLCHTKAGKTNTNSNTGDCTLTRVTAMFQLSLKIPIKSLRLTR